MYDYKYRENMQLWLYAKDTIAPHTTQTNNLISLALQTLQKQNKKHMSAKIQGGGVAKESRIFSLTKS